MYITCKGLTYAKYKSGGAGSAVVYENGAVAENLLAKVQLSFQYAEGQDYADGKRIAQKKKMIGCNSSMELADLPSAIKKALLGWEVATNDLMIGGAGPDYVGFGFYIWNETPVAEDDEWICYWVYKTKFTVDNIDVSTSNDSIAYQHQTMSGTGDGVQISSGGDTYFVVTNDSALSTEAAAIAWLKAKAGINS